jgi:hypothetical protein
MRAVINIVDARPLEPGEFRAALVKSCEVIAKDMEVRGVILAAESISWLACGEVALAMRDAAKSAECLTTAAKVRALAEANG